MELFFAGFYLLYPRKNCSYLERRDIFRMFASIKKVESGFLYMVLHLYIPSYKTTTAFRFLWLLLPFTETHIYVLLAWWVTNFPRNLLCALMTTVMVPQGGTDYIINMREAAEAATRVTSGVGSYHRLNRNSLLHIQPLNSVLAAARPKNWQKIEASSSLERGGRYILEHKMKP